VPGFELRAWFGIVVPAGTPDGPVARLNRAANTAMSNPGVRAKLAESGIDAVTGTPEQFAALIQGDLKKWGDAVRRSGAKAD
jgi:tripartite-type tricarboxylate transporter receptor subunit TctC